jgi:hypothetical protein
METLENLIIEPALYQYDTGPEAQVGDQVKLFLNQAANPGYPEFIFGTIQHPITKVNCDTATSYDIEYDEEDLLVPDSLLVTGDILSGTAVVSQIQVVANELDQEIADRIADVNAEEAARIAADALRVLITNGTSTNQTLINPTEATVNVGPSGATETLALTSGTFQIVTLTDNCTFTMPTPTAGKKLTLKLLSGAGGFTGTFTGVKWPAGSAPTITATAGKFDMLRFRADGTNWIGQVLGQNYTA